VVKRIWKEKERDEDPGELGDVLGESTGLSAQTAECRKTSSALEALSRDRQGKTRALRDQKKMTRLSCCGTSDLRLKKGSRPFDPFKAVHPSPIGSTTVFGKAG